MLQKSIIIIFCLLIAACNDTEQNKIEESKAGEAQISYQYEPSISELKGTLTSKVFWGPPNYGKDTAVDEKEKEYVLVLNKDITILKPDSDISEGYNAAIKNVSSLQIIHSQKLDKYLNKTVTVTGTLFGAQTGHHHTHVLLDLKTIH